MDGSNHLTGWPLKRKRGGGRRGNNRYLILGSVMKDSSPFLIRSSSLFLTVSLPTTHSLTANCYTIIYVHTLQLPGGDNRYKLFKTAKSPDDILPGDTGVPLERAWFSVNQRFEDGVFAAVNSSRATFQRGRGVGWEGGVGG